MKPNIKTNNNSTKKTSNEEIITSKKNNKDTIDHIVINFENCERAIIPIDCIDELSFHNITRHSHLVFDKYQERQIAQFTRLIINFTFFNLKMQVADEGKFKEESVSSRILQKEDIVSIMLSYDKAERETICICTKLPDTIAIAKQYTKMDIDEKGKLLKIMISNKLTNNHWGF